MGSNVLIRVVLVVLVATLAARAVAATPPALVAKRHQAQLVLQQVSAIDERLSVVTEQFDGARVTLAALRRRLTVERVSLTKAQLENRRAQLQVAKLLVTLYTTSRPATIELILGATSISAMLNAADAETAISREDTQIADVARQARVRLQLRVHALERDRASAALAVSQLAQSRAQIERGLARRRALLASVQAQIAQIQARERAQQEQLAAEARARLAAEARARLAAERVAQARLAAERSAAAAQRATRLAAPQTQVPATTPATTSTTTTAAVPALTGQTTTGGAPGATPSTQVTAPVQLPAGHPEAAQIALQYIGDPYLWGGESPSGFDCSGLVSYVFAQLGIDLPHYAADQYTYGVPVPVAQLQPGDLVFFDNLDHVGIYIGADQFVDAPDTGAFVRIDSLSDPWYASRYVGAQRV
jgi:cell wall-associated NlpC family hydrolase